MTDAAPTLKTGFAHSHPEPLSGARYSAVELMPGDRGVLVLDQRSLPASEHYDLCTDPRDVADAIRAMRVRGAPAIGVAAAYGMVLAAAFAPPSEDGFVGAMEEAAHLFVSTRPTAVNLAWAVARMGRVARSVAAEPAARRLETLAAEARGLHREDVAACRAMGALGAEAVAADATILTHCNAGALATGGYGSALGVVRAAVAAGKRVRVIATETRPFLQGARLTAWELSREGIDVTLITDSMVGHLMAHKAIDHVVVGADRIARNGDVANKIGTYTIACLAAAHGVPFDVVAPWSTVDLACPSGAEIPIEERDASEVLTIRSGAIELRIAPDGVAARHPAFDVTPARLVRSIVTERGVVRPPFEANLAALASASR
jgi:methylthioribose-1-phosphate isomerase